MVAATVHDLGIPAGRDSGTFEDTKIGKAADKRNWQAFRQLVEQRNAAAPVWAWKRPAIVFYTKEVLCLLRNPCLIMIYKDVLAVTHRKCMIRDQGFLDLLYKTCDFYRQMTALAQKIECPLLLVSYERAMAMQAEYVRELARFVGVHDPAVIHAATERTLQNKQQYLEQQGGIYPHL